MHEDEFYWAAGNIVAAIVFIVSWIYCVFAYGFLVGVGLGWLPSAICAVIARALWPLIVLAVIWFLWLAFGPPAQ